MPGASRLVPDIHGPLGGTTLATLTREQLVTIEVLHQRGQSQRETARILGVTEGAVRYHLRRAREGVADGRQKPSRIEQLGLAEAIAHWWQAQAEILGKGRPPSVLTLQEFLRDEYGYDGSYKSVRKFVRARYGRPPLRPSPRGQTPPRARGSKPRPAPRRRATGANSAASTSATPKGRRRSMPSSWSSATAARRPSSGAVRWTSSPGIASTTKPTAGSAASLRSTGSTTSRRASRGGAAPGVRSTSNIVSTPA